MNKLKNIAYIPTVASVVLTIIFAVVSLKFSGPSNEWVASLRDALFFFMQSETLLLATSAIIFLTEIGPSSKLRALTASNDSLECLSLIETIHDRVGPAPSFFNNLLATYLQQFDEQLAPLREGCYTSNAEEIPRITAELYREAKESIEAVSMIDLREYWTHPAWGATALEWNREAQARHVSVHRIFVIQRKEELVAYADLIKGLLDLEVMVRYIVMADTPENCRHDFSIYDKTKYAQYFEFEQPTFNKHYSRATVSMQEGSLAKYRLIFDRLLRLSTPISASSFDIPTGESRSLWTSGAFRDHYQGPPPELHLDKITTRYSTVLDVGCGAGRILTLFADMGCTVTGVETDASAIAICERKTANNRSVTLVNEEFSGQSFQHALFDIVIAYNSIYHSRREQMFDSLRHISEILTPDGHLLLTIKTTEGNGDALIGASAIEPNSWLGCNMPDYWAIHHFCDQSEIAEIKGLFGAVVHEERIPMVKKDGVIVQAAGLYLILRKR